MINCPNAESKLAQALWPHTCYYPTSILMEMAIEDRFGTLDGDAGWARWMGMLDGDAVPGGEKSGLH